MTRIIIKSLLKTLSMTFVLLFFISPLKASSPNETSVAEVKAVFKRLAGSELPQLNFDLVAGNNVSDWYQVTVASNVINVSASSSIALTYGAYHYLKSTGAMSVSWEGNRIKIPSQFSPYIGEKVSASFDLRTYLNVCAYGYSTPWWDWSRWQQEIDWMAVHGINNVIAMEGQEFVWQKLWNEFGLSNQELNDYFSGPAFTPWQRMGNIENHQGVLPQSWINKKHDLQIKILDRMRGLGIKPVLPAFSGYIPKQFMTKYPNAKVIEMKGWSGFKNKTYWLDPADPLFAKLAKRFLEIYNGEYGKGEYYLSDSFNEMHPPVSDDNKYQDLANYGDAIYQSIKQVVPDATWVMQGWMFGADKKFWDNQAISAFLSKVPNDKAMVHDIGNDRYHVWQNAESFHDKKWVFGFIHNYGASNPIYGDFNYYQQQVKGLLEDKNKGNLSGFGVFPEGINNNSVVYEYLFDLAWDHKEHTFSQWIDQYTAARYGHNSPQLMQAWPLLEQSVYSTQYWDSRWWNGAGAYLFFKRPQLGFVKFEKHPGDMVKLREALDILISVASEYQDSPLFMHDLIDFYRHYLTIEIDKRLLETTNLYVAGKIATADTSFEKVKKLVDGMDLLSGNQADTLSQWIDDASKYSNSAAESNYYAKNAKMQVSLWGGNSLRDYASKAWQGMYKHFYLPRWTLFFETLKNAAIEGTEVDNGELAWALIQWEQTWVEQPLNLKHEQPEEPIKLIYSLEKLIK
ncbi:alpha-N-acetylglucosaminidase [Paraglaciecola sp. L3A3]|uniref:alpha-N-acetylglucosaminidase n=1 Tax=Paraglaciecola sp. L3A3 TaxID=2686358 RepID=UPI00131DA16E|nr:alpha-N-acetylglucosaminidase [Paraglaciecola sp. L3A3]